MNLILKKKLIYIMQSKFISPDLCQHNHHSVLKYDLSLLSEIIGFLCYYFCIGDMVNPVELLIHD